MKTIGAALYGFEGAAEDSAAARGGAAERALAVGGGADGGAAAVRVLVTGTAE